MMSIWPRASAQTACTSVATMPTSAKHAPRSDRGPSSACRVTTNWSVPGPYRARAPITSPFGRFFPSRTKPQAVPASRWNCCARPGAKVRIPVVAIGGITPDNGVLIDAGADALAVIEGVFNQPRHPCSRRTLRQSLSPTSRIAMSYQTPKSHEQFARAKRSIAGGVNSAVRAFKQVGGEPVFFARGQGAYLFDVDGNKYIDYVASWGPSILGHAHPAVVKAVCDTAATGLSYGAPTVIETEMAELLKQLLPSIEKVRMVSSGTEATMSAIRLARGFTGRDKIVKFEGCYHGSGDSLLVKAGSSALTLGVPSSPGVPAALAELTLTLDYNNIEQLRATFGKIGHEIAGVIVEPVAGNMNCIPPLPGFLEALRALQCTQHGALLIFDEVMTGFRVRSAAPARSRFRAGPGLCILAANIASAQLLSPSVSRL